MSNKVRTPKLRLTPHFSSEIAYSQWMDGWGDAIRSISCMYYKRLIRAHPNRYAPGIAHLVRAANLDEQSERCDAAYIVVNLPPNSVYAEYHDRLKKALKKIYIMDWFWSWELGENDNQPHPHFNILLTVGNTPQKARLIKEFANSFNVARGFINVTVLHKERCKKIITYSLKEKLKYDVSGVFLEKIVSALKFVGRPKRNPDSFIHALPKGKTQKSPQKETNC